MICPNGGKKGYATEKSAKRNKRGYGTLRAYRCPYCHQYHLTRRK